MLSSHRLTDDGDGGGGAEANTNIRIKIIKCQSRLTSNSLKFIVIRFVTLVRSLELCSSARVCLNHYISKIPSSSCTERWRDLLLCFHIELSRTTNLCVVLPSSGPANIWAKQSNDHVTWNSSSRLNDSRIQSTHARHQDDDYATPTTCIRRHPFSCRHTCSFFRPLLLLPLPFHSAIRSWCPYLSTRRFGCCCELPMGAQRGIQFTFHTLQSALLLVQSLNWKCCTRCTRARECFTQSKPKIKKKMEKTSFYFIFQMLFFLCHSLLRCLFCHLRNSVALLRLHVSSHTD